MNYNIVSRIHVPFGPNATGGSEEYHVRLAEALVERGHEVVSYAPLRMGQAGVTRGVYWRDILRLDRTAPGVWIIQRDPDVNLGWPQRDDQLMCFAAHDIDYGPVWTERYDIVFADSETHANYLRHAHPGARVIASGAYPQLQLADQVPAVVRNPKRILWSSSYDRGLEPLLRIVERAREWVPDLELAVCYGWESIECRFDERPWLRRFQERLNGTMERLGVQQLGRLPSSLDVWAEFAKSGMWVYPTQWAETACQSVMEAQAFGAIPVFTPHWALCENGRHGVRIHGDPYNNDLVRSRFVQAVVRLATDADYQQTIRVPMMADARATFQFSRVVDCIESATVRHFSKELVPHGLSQV